jgi:hypothetical protein
VDCFGTVKNLTNIKREGATSPPVEYTDYVSILKERLPEIPSVSIIIANNHTTKKISWKVLVSNDSEGAAGTWAEEKAAADLSAESVAKHVLSAAYTWIDIQVQSEDSESPQAATWILGVG